MIKSLLKISTLAGSAVLLAACATTPVEEIAAIEVAPVLDVTVHEGDFARIEQFTTPGGVSVWLVNEPSIPIVSFSFIISLSL